MLVYEGNILRTQPGAEMAMTFYDSSILRLATDTTVEIQEGNNSDGNPVAQMILQNGALWGRVLTATGQNYGTNEFIAGVRGTSVALSRRAAEDVKFAIPHSINDGAVTQPAARIQPLVGPGGGTYEMLRGTQFSFSSGAFSPGMIPPNTVSDISPMYSGDAWIRTNTLKDHHYLTQISQDPMSPVRERALNELTVSSRPETLSAMCSGSHYWVSLRGYGDPNFVCQDLKILTLAEYKKTQSKALFFPE